MPVREGVINNDLMSSNNGHHGWFSCPAPSGGLREITRRAVLCLLPFCAWRYLPVSLLFFPPPSSSPPLSLSLSLSLFFSHPFLRLALFPSRASIAIGPSAPLAAPPRLIYTHVPVVDR